jgi:hypothetical protein
MMKKNFQKNIRNIFLLLAAILVNALYFPSAHAASLTTLSDLMSRQAAAVASDHTIKFTTPTGLTAGQTITVTFPAGFNLSTVVFGDVDFSYGATGTETNATLAATASGTTWGAAVSGQVLTLTSGSSSIAAGNKVIIGIGLVAGGTHQITNHATPGTYILTIGGTFADSGKIAIIVTSSDQVAMTAAVDPSITFSLSANVSAFGTLSTGSVAISSPNITLTVATNANSGYAISVKDQGNGTTGGLYNVGTGTTIPSSSATLAAGTEGYGIQATAAGGAVITAPYNGSGNVVGQLQTAAQSLATYGTSTTASHTVTVTHKAAISASSKAGNYADTLTYIATATF